MISLPVHNWWLEPVMRFVVQTSVMLSAVNACIGCLLSRRIGAKAKGACNRPRSPDATENLKLLTILSRYKLVAYGWYYIAMTFTYDFCSTMVCVLCARWHGLLLVVTIICVISMSQQGDIWANRRCCTEYLALLGWCTATRLQQRMNTTRPWLPTSLLLNLWKG